MTGLDSSFFAGSNVLCLGDSIKDPSTPFPSDFNIKELVKSLAIAKAHLIEMGLMKPNEPDRDKARPAVVRLARGNPCVKVIPKPDLSSVEYEILEECVPCEDTNEQVDTTEYINGNADKYPGDDYMEKLKNWYRVNSHCTDEDIKVQMLVLTGKLIPDDIVQSIRRILDES